MPNEQEYSGVSMRDVLEALAACHDDQGADVRIVVKVRVDGAGKRVLSILAEAFDSDGRPVPGVPYHSSPWPTNQFRTMTQAMHHLVGLLYDSLEYMRYNSAKELRDRQQ